MRKIRDMLEGADNTMRELILSALKDGYAQGQELWYDVPDYGEHSFRADRISSRVVLSAPSSISRILRITRSCVCFSM